jgi:polynucleotide 5'-kinase involved in rRNA processing
MALVATLAFVAVNGIYPSDHWDHATKLTTTNFESFVKGNVDSGKTLFVRWIASAG